MCIIGWRREENCNCDKNLQDYGDIHSISQNFHMDFSVRVGFEVILWFCYFARKSKALDD